MEEDWAYLKRTNIKEFCESIAAVIHEQSEKELFKSLALFKDKQLLEIKKLVDYIEYV